MKFNSNAAREHHYFQAYLRKVVLVKSLFDTFCDFTVKHGNRVVFRLGNFMRWWLESWFRCTAPTSPEDNVPALGILLIISKI